MKTPTQHPIRPVLISGKWHVENLDTGEVFGPFDSSWSAIEKTQQLRNGMTATVAAQAKKSLRYER